jgi:hypothetical protein
MSKKLSLLVPAVVLGFSANAFAWSSIALLGKTTHTKIAIKALEVTDLNQYPDMDYHSDGIRNGSTSEAGHEKIHNGGGKLKDWWDGADGRGTLKGGVLPNYTQLKIDDAYMNIGRMCHLTQDQAVPAHAGHIPHSIVVKLPADGVETYVKKDTTFGEIPLIASDRSPYEYYQALQNDTRSHLPEWVSPVTGKPFWVEAEDGGRFRDVTLGPIGTYGTGTDTFLQSAKENLKAGGLSAREILYRQLGMAAGYTRALIESASKTLPPLVSGFGVYPNVLAPGHKAEISFTALENRTRHVKYSVTISPKDGQPVAAFTGDVNLDKPRPSFNNTGDNAPAVKPADESLFNKHVTIKWDGTVAGRQLPEGTYMVQVQLTDDDGNIVPDSVNADDTHDNDTLRVLSVVSTEPEDMGLSFN